MNVYKEVDRSAFAMKNWINLNVLFYFAITLKMSKVPLNRSSCSICFSICQLFTQFYESEAFHLMHSVDIYLKKKKYHLIFQFDKHDVIQMDGILSKWLKLCGYLFKWLNNVTSFIFNNTQTLSVYIFIFHICNVLLHI